jgi:carbamoyl-phosphate synthase large subunit
VPLAKIASRVMLGATLAELRHEGLLKDPINKGHVSVKEAVLPFNRFPEVDTALGPEMRSTGEVMGIDSTFGRAFVKAETAAGTELPTSGMVFLTLNDRDKSSGLVIAERLRQLGLGIVATSGTAEYLKQFGYPVDRIVGKVSEPAADSAPHMDGDAVELLKRGEISFVINTPSGRRTRTDGEAIRKAANIYRVSSVTTIKAALAAVHGLAEAQEHPLEVRSLQEYHGR